MKKILINTMASAMAFSAIMGSAQAGYKVDGPVVHKGEMEFETFGAYTKSDSNAKDGALGENFAVGYGFTDHLRGEAEFEMERKNSDDAFEGRASELSLQYMPFAPGSQFVDFAVKGVYVNTTEDNTPDKYEIIGLFGKDFGTWQVVGNVGFESDFGDHAHDERELDSALQVRYKLNDSYKLGAEWFTGYGEFGDFGGWDEQEHLVGPVVYGKIGDTGLGWHAGVLKGVSEVAPDYVFKWYLSYEFDL